MSANEPSSPDSTTPRAEDRGPGFAAAPQPGTPAGYPSAPAGQQYPTQPYPGPQAFPAQPYPGPQYPTQPYPGQPYAAQPASGQPHAGQQYAAQPNPAQPWAGQPYQPPQPGQPYAGPQAFSAQPSADQPLPAAAGPGPTTDHARPERIGRGLLFSLGGIVVGVVLTLVLWKLNFIASITSFAMAYAVIWLYTLGAGSAPRKGFGAVIAVIVAGVAISLTSIVGADLLDYLASNYPDASTADKLQFVGDNILRPQVWEEYTSDAFMYVLFAALGTFGLIRQIGRGRGAR